MLRPSTCSGRQAPRLVLLPGAFPSDKPRAADRRPARNIQAKSTFDGLDEAAATSAIQGPKLLGRAGAAGRLHNGSRGARPRTVNADALVAQLTDDPVTTSSRLDKGPLLIWARVTVELNHDRSFRRRTTFEVETLAGPQRLNRTGPGCERLRRMNSRIQKDNPCGTYDRRSLRHGFRIPIDTGNPSSPEFRKIHRAGGSALQQTPRRTRRPVAGSAWPPFHLCHVA